MFGARDRKGRARGLQVVRVNDGVEVATVGVRPRDADGERLGTMRRGNRGDLLLRGRAHGHEVPAVVNERRRVGGRGNGEGRGAGEHLETSASGGRGGAALSPPPELPQARPGEHSDGRLLVQVLLCVRDATLADTGAG